LTTADILERHGHLPMHLRTALDAYTAIVADAMAVAVHDGQLSTARLISGAYSGAPPGEYGPREPPQRALDAAGRVTALERAIPEEMRPVLHRLVREETGLHQGRPPSLAGFGNQYGWNAEKQAVAAGGMLAVCACMELHHQLMHGIGKVKKGSVHLIYGAPKSTEVERSLILSAFLDE
jgi:hypothetical protein